MRLRRTSSAALLAAAVAAGALATTGETATPRYESTVSLRVTSEGDETVFRGRVRSEDDRCERRRVRITAGNGFKSPPEPEGTTRTDATGRYELRVQTKFNNIGNYRAKALRKSRRAYVCKPARSDIENPAV